MRRIVTLLPAAALAGALVVPGSAVAAEAPLPQLSHQDLTQQACQAKDPQLPPRASVLIGPFVPKAPAVPQQAQAPQTPQICSQQV